MPVCQMPFIMANEISEEEKTAWHNARLAEVKAGTYKGKEITPDFEPIEGWKPLKRYGSGPSSIIRGAVYDQSRVGIYPGDYIRETVLGTQYKFIIVEIGSTPYCASPAALMVADKPSPEAFHASDEVNFTDPQYPDEGVSTRVGRWKYQYSRIAQYDTYFYHSMPPYIANNILEASVPYAYFDVGDVKWDVGYYHTRVFTPSVNEFCAGSPSPIESDFEEAFIPWPKIYQNSIDDLSKLNDCWLRTIRIHREPNKQLVCTTHVTNDLENGGKPIYVYSRGIKKHALLCFCMG